MAAVWRSLWEEYCVLSSPAAARCFFHQLVDGRPGDPAAVLKGDEQRVLIHQSEHIPLCDPVGQGAETCLIEIEHPLLVALAQNPELISPNIRYIQPDELRDPEAAVEKQGQDTVISGLVDSVH